ncbi:protein kinase [Clostridium sp. 'deep sea']|uniref:protein kinase domain-containing protein n=1 Tax=Clostridium sp. 'deep sea' TaxID=2779445 RepID=UPI00189658BC|nr:protein kinase [Clostridium sp. 'deep sea']QOR35055.1 protein kinase [Clostridium sp. 'deep sea']
MAENKYNNNINNSKIILSNNTVYDHNTNKTVYENNSHEPLNTGLVLNDKYQLIDILSNNTGEAAIYLCLYNNQNYVAKIYFKSHKHKQEISKRINNVNSNYVIKILEEGWLGERFYEIMPYYHQGDLLQAGKIDYKTLKNLIIPCINEGLKDIHQIGVLHRDIKPNNIFFNDTKSKVILGDFGISTTLKNENSVVYTSVARTLGYASPETAHGYFSKESDYYAFGITILHLALGKSPFLNMTEQQIVFNTLNKAIEIPKTVELSLAYLIKGLTLKDRTQRWGYNEVVKWLKGNPIKLVNSYNIKPQNVYVFEANSYTNLGELAIGLAHSWQQAKKHLYRGLIQDFLKQHGQDLVSKCIDCTNEKNKDIGLFKLLYILNKDLPLCWRGQTFKTLKDLGTLINSQLPTIQERYLTMLQSKVLSHYMQIKGFNASKIASVRYIEKLAQTNKVKAYLKLSYLLTNNSQFKFQDKSFYKLNDLLIYLKQQQNYLQTNVNILNKSLYFLTWLEQLGFIEQLKSFEKNQIDIFSLLESCVINKQLVRDLYIIKLSKTKQYYLYKNLNSYNFINSQAFQLLKNITTLQFNNELCIANLKQNELKLSQYFEQFLGLYQNNPLLYGLKEYPITAKNLENNLVNNSPLEFSKQNEIKEHIQQWSQEAKKIAHNNISTIKKDNALLVKRREVIFTPKILVVFKMLISVITVLIATRYLWSAKNIFSTTTSSTVISLYICLLVLCLFSVHKIGKTVVWLNYKKQYKAINSQIKQLQQFFTDEYLNNNKLKIEHYFNHIKDNSGELFVHKQQKLLNINRLLNERKTIIYKANMPLVKLKYALVIFVLIISAIYTSGSLPTYIQKFQQVTGLQLKTAQTYVYYQPKIKANVRDKGSLTGQVLFVVSKDQKLKYLNQQTQDNEGRVWYYVETQKGKGWICKKIIKPIE